MNNQAAQTMPELPVTAAQDDFTGTDASVINAARALIRISDSGSLSSPLGGHARALLAALCARLEAALTREAPTEAVEKIAPVQGYTPGIPWSMHLEAYDVYCKRYGKQQALIEGGCRGGFGTDELDMFIPGWRERLSGFNAMKAKIATLQARITELEAATPPAPQQQSAKEVAIVCDWKDADPFPRFIEADVDGRSVSLEWRDREDGLRELIVPAHTQSDYPGCSGDPASCPENEGYGCCKPNPPRLAQGECRHSLWSPAGGYCLDCGYSPVGPDEESAIDAAVGLAKVVLRLPVELLGEIDHRAQQSGCVRNAYLRQLLAEHHTQPPHQDRGEVNLDQVDAALFCTPVTDDGDELAMPIDCMNMGTPEQLPLARTIMRAALTAALTEAKQQDTDWRAFPYSNAWCDGLAACLRECGEHEAARQIDDIKRFVSDAVEAKQQGPGEVLARGWFHALPEDDYEFHDDASGAGKDCVGCIRAVIVRETPQVEAKRQRRIPAICNTYLESRA